MITGQQVRLRPIERADLPRFVRWFADPELREGLALFMPVGEAQEEQWFEGNLALPLFEQTLAIDALAAGGGLGLRPAAGEPGWTHIGSCGFHEIDWRNRWAQVGIAIGDKAQWNKGYGTEAMSLMVGLAFNDLNLHRVALRVFSGNARAIRCYEKVGFQTEGRLRESEFRGGRYQDNLIMAILRSEWEPH